MSWTVEVLNKIVQKELESLPKDLRAKFLYIAEMLEEFGPQNVGGPFVKPLKLKKSSLWEMRMKGKSGIARAIYVTIKKERIVVLHAFIKKTQKTPQKALDIAIKRLTEVEND
jgi:phage-related protein